MDEIHDRADAGSPANGTAAPERSDKGTRKNAGRANLRPPWPKGTSGNPAGRPKGTSIVARILELVAQDTGGGKTISDRIAAKFVAEALKGKFTFAREVLERVDGKVSERVEHTGSGGGPIVIDATVRERAGIGLDAWRKEQAEKLAALTSSVPLNMSGPPPTAPTSSANS